MKNPYAQKPRKLVEMILTKPSVNDIALGWKVGDRKKEWLTREMLHAVRTLGSHNRTASQWKIVRVSNPFL